MRLFTGFLFMLLLAACGSDEPSAADLAAEAEAERIEAATAELENSTEAVEESADELIDALDSLDVLFPEEDN